jgi:hypothetical protein
MGKPPDMGASRVHPRDYRFRRAEELRALASSAPWTLSDLAAGFRLRAHLMERGHDEVEAASIVTT